MRLGYCGALVCLGLIFGCKENGSTSAKSTSKDTTMNNVHIPNPKNFTNTIDGKKASLFILKNTAGIEVAITNYGGRIVGMKVPDRNGKLVDVVVGFNSVKDYQNSTEPYFGATIGRYGNRIAKGKFTLDKKDYALFINNAPNTLHGGKKGFQSVVWDANQPNDSSLQLSYLSKDIEEGFPGNLNVTVTFTLLSDGIKINYSAKTDKNTVINLTNHAFFNLNGEGSGTILNHSLQIFADKYTPVDSTLIPTGKLETVHKTPFDFTVLIAIGKSIDYKNEQLSNGKGYDHNFVLKDDAPNASHHAAKVVGDQSGIVMDVYTTEPGLQLYSGNFMKSKNTFKSGAKDDFRTAYCLETQHFPDSPNQPNFPSTDLTPGKEYKSETMYRFSVSK